MDDNAFVMLLQLLCYKMSKLEILPRRSLMEEDQSVRSVFLLSRLSRISIYKVQQDNLDYSSVTLIMLIPAGCEDKK